MATSRQGGSDWRSRRREERQGYGERDREFHDERDRGFRGNRQGVRVEPDMSDPGVARITIEINYEELITRMIKKMGETIRTRRSRSRGTTGKAHSRSKSRARSK